MTTTRREFLEAGALGIGALASSRAIFSRPGQAMYGLIGKMNVVAGQRDALIAILLEGTTDMPGCLSYVIARDASDEDAIWVTEVWDSQTSHQASLSLRGVQDAIARGRPMIAGFEDRIVTEPVGMQG
jgi:quinol monooxygenase YgiN